MNSKELANILSEVLIPIGFKKKGNCWVVNSNEITKIVNLQKSQFGNYFYINYGYILNALPLIGLMHLYNRIASSNKDENLRIDKLLDIDNDISDEDRTQKLKEVLFDKLVKNINSVNTEADVLGELKKRPHLNDIPLVVKRYFNLPE